MAGCHPLAAAAPRGSWSSEVSPTPPRGGAVARSTPSKRSSPSRICGESCTARFLSAPGVAATRKVRIAPEGGTRAVDPTSSLMATGSDFAAARGQGPPHGCLPGSVPGARPPRAARDAGRLGSDKRGYVNCDYCDPRARPPRPWQGARPFRRIPAGRRTLGRRVVTACPTRRCTASAHRCGGGRARWRSSVATGSRRR